MLPCRIFSRVHCSLAHVIILPFTHSTFLCKYNNNFHLCINLCADTANIDWTVYMPRQCLCQMFLLAISFVRWPWPCTKHKRYRNAYEQLLNQLKHFQDSHVLKTKHCAQSQFFLHKTKQLCTLLLNCFFGFHNQIRVLSILVQMIRYAKITNTYLTVSFLNK